MNVDDVIGESDVNYDVALLHEKTSYLLPENIPLKKKVISIKDQLKPCITPAIKSNIKRRHHYCRLYKQNRISKHEYNSFRNTVNN